METNTTLHGNTHTHTHTHTQAKEKIISVVGGDQQLEQLSSGWSTFKAQAPEGGFQLPDQGTLSGDFLVDPRRKRKSVLDQFLVDNPYADIPEFNDAFSRLQQGPNDGGQVPGESGGPQTDQNAGVNNEAPRPGDENNDEGQAAGGK
jgi:hypothetical protein